MQTTQEAYKSITRNDAQLTGGEGGVTRPTFGYGVPPGPSNPDPVYEKKFVKILKS